MTSIPPSTRPEWRIEDGLTDYPTALATMQDAVAAIRAGDGGRTGLAGRASAALHRRHLGQARRPDRPGPVPHLQRRPRRPMDLSRAGPAHGLRHARPHPPARTACPRATCAAMCNGLEEWLIRTLAASTSAVSGARAESASGSPTPPPAGGENWRHRRARHPLGQLAWRRAECRAEPVAFQRDRAVRAATIRRDQPRRPRHPRDDA